MYCTVPDMVRSAVILHYKLKYCLTLALLNYLTHEMLKSVYLVEKLILYFRRL